MQAMLYFNMTLKVLGGLFPVIEKEKIGYFTYIGAGEIEQLSGPPLMRLGKVKVTLTVYTSEADKTMATENVFWWFVFPSLS